MHIENPYAGPGVKPGVGIIYSGEGIHPISDLIKMPGICAIALCHVQKIGKNLLRIRQGLVTRLDHRNRFFGQGQVAEDMLLRNALLHLSQPNLPALRH